MAMRVEAVVCVGRDARARRGLAAAGLAVICFVALLVGVPGCSRQAPPASDSDKLRIVSFMPSATRIVVDLGLGDRLVGVAEHDAAAPPLTADGRPMPIVGNYMDVDVERLLSLRPSHVIFPETATAGLPDTLAAQSTVQVRVLPYPATVSQVVDGVRVLGESLSEPERAGELADALELWRQRKQADWDSLDASLLAIYDRDGQRLAKPFRWRVLLAFSVDPVVASGPGSINDELLALAGAVNAVGTAAVSAVTLDREALIATNPDVIVLLLPGASEAEAANKIAWFDGLPIAAVEEGRVHALTDPQVLLPSTNLPGVLEQLVGAIWGHGRAAADTDQSEAGR